MHTITTRICHPFNILFCICFSLLSCSESTDEGNSNPEQTEISKLNSYSSHNASSKQLTLPKIENTFDITDINSLSRLFTNSIVKGDQIIWAPDFEDLFEFSKQRSSDAYCHTVLDTSFMYDNVWYVLFKTNRYKDTSIIDCHACSPIVSIASFKQNKGHFELVNFKKAFFDSGSFGNHGDLEITTLLYPCIKFKSAYMGQGVLTRVDYYYDLEYFEEIFYLESDYNSEGMYGVGAPKYFEHKRTIEKQTQESFVVNSNDIVFSKSGKKTEKRTKILVERTKSDYDSILGGSNLNVSKL